MFVNIGLIPYICFIKLKVMGRIKDLVIELQNEFGYNMEEMPHDFNMDEYLEKKSSELEREPLFCELIKSKIKNK